MSLLTPLFLLGGTAIALPILFHLIRRTTRERMAFSSLMFLRESPPRMTRRSRLEHLFLLLLRCLIILLLALAFARPFFTSTAPRAGQGDLMPMTVLLLDTSASMRRENLWEQAMAKAREHLDELAANENVAVLTFDRQTDSVMDFTEWSKLTPAERAAQVVNRLEAIEPGWGETGLDQALIFASELLVEAGHQSSMPREVPRRIVVISDLQEGSRLNGLQAYEWPDTVGIALERVTAKQVSNAGLQRLAPLLQETALKARKQTRLRVINAADSEKDQFQIRWPGAPEQTRVNVHVPPGQSRIVSVNRPEGTSAGTRVVLAGDDADFDNTLHVVPIEPFTTRILYLGAESPEDPEQPLFYLRRALHETARRTLELEVLNPSQSWDYPGETSFPLVILNGSRSDPASLVRFLEDGNTVLLLLTEPGSAGMLGTLVGTGEVNVRESTGQDYALLAQIDFSHPILAPFADPRYSDFTGIHFWRHRIVEPETLPEARVLAWFEQEAPALIEIPVGNGRLLVLTSGWQPADSQLALSSKFVPLFYSILTYAAPETVAPNQYAVGSSIRVPEFLRQPGKPLSLRTPDGEAISLEGDSANYNATGTPGIYVLSNGSEAYQTAVNLSAKESETTPLDRERLVQLGVPLGNVEQLTAQQISRQQHWEALELENRQKLWRWLILAGFLVLLLEMIVSGWSTRRVTTVEPATT